jgi:hypothetical protein
MKQISLTFCKFSLENYTCPPIFVADCDVLRRGNEQKHKRIFRHFMSVFSTDCSKRYVIGLAGAQN